MSSLPYFIFYDKSLEKKRGKSYDRVMFSLNYCAAGCGRLAITDSKLCAPHSADVKAEEIRISNLIKRGTDVCNLNAPYMRFENEDFSGRRFYACNFKSSLFSVCDFSNCSMQLVLFEFADFYNCSFRQTNLEFLSFAGARFQQVFFENSDLVNINYGGASIVNCSFNDSGMYNSRFINADMVCTSLINCDIKRTNFIMAKRKSVSFKTSNTGEAIFEMSE